jgi:hypothetical protein
VYTRYFWQGNHWSYGHIRCVYTVLANPCQQPCTAFWGCVLVGLVGFVCRACLLGVFVGRVFQALSVRRVFRHQSANKRVGQKEMYIYATYDRIFNDIPAKIPYIHHIYMVLAKPTLQSVKQTPKMVTMVTIGGIEFLQPSCLAFPPKTSPLSLSPS